VAGGSSAGTAPAAEVPEVLSWPLDPARTGPGHLAARIQTVGTPALSETPIVFLHGLVGLNDHWEGVVLRVRDRFRCTMFELPLLSLAGDDCSIQGVTRLTARFIDEKVGRPAVLVGNSFGGHVALRIALEKPEAVAGLVLAGSGGILEKTFVADIQIRPTREWLRRKIGELFFDQANVSEADVDRAFEELSRRSGARAMVKLSRSARRDELRDLIGRIAAPTLLIWGRQDIITPPEAAHGFASLIRHSRLEWIDRCGHAPMIEAPQRFADLLAEFAGRLA
jgi:pimeloyl-ACP methyl ester carboxylesterase